MVILLSCFRSISAFVQVILAGSGLPVTVAGSSILVPAFTVRPRNFTSGKFLEPLNWKRLFKTLASSGGVKDNLD